MAEITRQQNLLVAEDWKKVYQSFRNADFQAYDYETLRKAMVDYIRTYYPEDFNDFIESSEFTALIDLIAFFGQALAFRGDLNQRENYMDTAERRDSVLRLARLVSYKAQRNTPASGLLKIDSVSTTESIEDSEGIDLSNLKIFWNDTTNPNWLEQFVSVTNAAFITGQRVGKPGHSQIINGITTDEYKVNLASGANTVYKFSTDVQGSTMGFEIVGATSQGKSNIYEVSPGLVGSTFNILSRNDGLGNSSNDTGWFLYFKQGSLVSAEMNLQESLSNRITNVNVDNINNTDVWLYKLDANSLVSNEWVQVPSVGFQNIAYNKASFTNKKLYEVVSRINDQVDLVFGDGVFADIPQGRFRLYYRTGNNQSYKIVPAEMNNITISIPYQSKKNRAETLTISASLKYTVVNARSRETLAEIRQRAPQQYYTQNRMVNGEDYNIVPFTQFSNIVKAKAVNRTSSGISRFLDVLDSTGKYSSTNIFCEDGILYKNQDIKSFTFEFDNKNDIQRIIEQNILDILESENLKHFYYYYFKRFNVTTVISPPWEEVTWTQVTRQSNNCTGYLVSVTDTPVQLGTYVSGTMSHVTTGAILKFNAGPGNYFDINRQIQAGTPSSEGEETVIYSTPLSINEDGVFSVSELDVYGEGPVVLNQVIPTGAVLEEIIPAYNNGIDSNLRADLVTKIFEYKNFGLGFDPDEFAWYIITEENLNIVGEFSQTNAKNTSGTNLDASWLVRFETDATVYTVFNRSVEYFFESELETRFYFDTRQRIYNPRSGFVVDDTIKMLRVNAQPDSLVPFNNPISTKIYDNVVENDGFLNTKRIKVSFTDADSDGVPDNPDFFVQMVDPSTNPTNKRVYYQISGSEQIPLPFGTVVTRYATLAAIDAAKSSYVDGTIFYASTPNKFYVLDINGTTRTVSESTDYTYKVGRQNLIFQYRHNAPNNRRIDPAPNNIIDLYLLTKTFNEDYRAWVTDFTNTIVQPSDPTSEELRLEFQSLESLKMLSDTLIYNSAKFKPLFGSKADTEYRAKFKVVRNANSSISDTEIKIRLVNAINTYFAIDNWDFGETFYFTELNAYLHKSLAPNVSSIVLVPYDTSRSFGDLFQVNAEPDEIFISAATVNDVEIISAITSKQINQL